MPAFSAALMSGAGHFVWWRFVLADLAIGVGVGLVELLKLGIFVVLGSLLTRHGLLGLGWAAVAIVAATLLVARPVAVFTDTAGAEWITRRTDQCPSRPASP